MKFENYGTPDHLESCSTWGNLCGKPRGCPDQQKKSSRHLLSSANYLLPRLSIILAFIARCSNTRPFSTIAPPSYKVVLGTRHICSDTMFITRAASRSTPRLALRANYNTLSGLRHRLQPALRPIACTTQSVTSYQKAGFRTSLTKLDVTSQHLSTKLEKEIEFEKDSSDRRTDSDENVRTFCKQNSFWEIEDKSGEPEIVLRRKYEDESIVVVFSIADLETPSPYIDDEVDDALTDNDGEPETMGSQSGGANSKGAINQGGKPDGNFAVAPQDSAAPGDREGLSDEEVC